MKIVREIEAVQFTGEGMLLPKDWHLCVPEVHWSAGRKFIYFTYATLRPKYWMGVERSETRPVIEPGAFDAWAEITVNGTGEKYHRQVLPFQFWDVKSEASMNARAGKADAHRAVYLTDDLASLWMDYRVLHDDWPNPLPVFAEFRVTDGAYGRSFLPFYLGVGDWLIHDPVKFNERVHGYEVWTDQKLKEFSR